MRSLPPLRATTNVVIEILLEARAGQQRVQIDRHPHRCEPMIRYHDDVGAILETRADDRRAHLREVEVGALSDSSACIVPRPARCCVRSGLCCHSTMSEGCPASEASFAAGIA